MKSLKNMYWSWQRGVFLSLLMVACTFTVFSLLESHAAENSVTVTSMALDETTIIEFENTDSGSEIGTIRMWLGSNFNFESFKTENGWIGKKTPQNVIVFTTTNPIKEGESVKFGIKTNKPKPGINWKALDKEGVQIDTGITLVTDIPSEKPSTGKTPDKDKEKEPPKQILGVLEKSAFRLVPDKPNVGGTIRATGNNFGLNQPLEFYIDNQRLESFKTDEKGNFLITTQIPENMNADRVEFMIKDAQGNEKVVSIRLGEATERMNVNEDILLTINSIPPVFHRGDPVMITGTATPGSTVTATIKNEKGTILTTIAVDVEANGTWKYEGFVNPGTPYGKQTAEITDGKQTILRSWSVESSKTIEIFPTALKFEPGEVISFNGTAKPNIPLEIVVEDPQGIEVYSDVFTVNESGEIGIEFPTEQSYTEGTYVLFASQERDQEIVLVGLGELPQVKLIAKMDKLNYKPNSIANLGINGPPSSTVAILIVDPSDQQKLADTVILEPDGSANYEIDLTGFGSGVYTAVVTRGNAQSSDVFSLGLQTGSGPIEATTTKDLYSAGEPILLLGSSGSNILLTITLTDPSGGVVTEKETFTNKVGQFSESSIRIPSDAVSGIWFINVKSGPNFKNIEIEVAEDVLEGIVVSVNSVIDTPNGKLVKFTGFGAATSQSVIITVVDRDQNEVEELTVVSTGVGDFLALWLVPRDLEPGVFTIIAKDAFNEGQTTLVWE